MTGGYSEAEVREHSLDWIRSTLDEVRRWRRFNLADLLNMTAIGNAAVHSEAAHAQYVETFEALRAEEDESLTWITNPHATTDMQAVREGPLSVTRVRTGA